MDVDVGEGLDFTLADETDRDVTPSGIGEPVVLIFYPADWSPVCSDEPSVFSATHELFRARGTHLLGASVDGKWCHQAFRSPRNLAFALPADVEPKGAVAQSYGAYRGDEGIAERALFVIDAQGRVAWREVSLLGVNTGANGALRAVEEPP